MKSSRLLPPSESDSGPAPTPHYLGHRARLRTRFLEAPESLPDYEVLELLLSYVQTRADTKPQAKALLDRFHTLAGVLGASVETLAQVPGIGPLSGVFLKVVQAVCVRAAQDGLRESPVFSRLDDVMRYCQTALGHAEVEHFRILFLNTQGRLIRDELQTKGTLSETAIYPREVIKRALALNAAALIMVHNHPGGDPTPSQADIHVTQIIQDAARPLDIQILDHLIVGHQGCVSLREKGLF